MKKVTALAAVIDPNHGEDVGLLLHIGSKKLYVWKIGDHLGHSLMLV